MLDDTAYQKKVYIVATKTTIMTDKQQKNLQQNVTDLLEKSYQLYCDGEIKTDAYFKISVALGKILTQIKNY